MSPEAQLLRLAYIDINALLVGGFDTNAQDLVNEYRTHGITANLSVPDGIAQTLTEIRDLFGADDMNRPGYFDC
tara:strand:+ start:1344 stop:1565 length:222 start_codon:yes stop_codon:yes gene_type:complete